MINDAISEAFEKCESKPKLLQMSEATLKKWCAEGRMMVSPLEGIKISGIPVQIVNAMKDGEVKAI